MSLGLSWEWPEFESVAHFKMGYLRPRAHFHGTFSKIPGSTIQRQPTFSFPIFQTNRKAQFAKLFELIKVANSFLKSHILRSKNLPDFPWPGHRDSDASLGHIRFPHLRVLLRSLHLHLLPPPLSFPRSFLLPPAPFLPLFRRRLPPLLSPMSASVNFSQDKDAPVADPAAKTVRVMIKGRVQGVFYRDWTINNANELGLKGWVRNRRDGSVEALFSGIPDKVAEMEQRCRRGPPDAMVTAFQIFPSTDDPGTSFQRKPTV
ncbi:uncharacterized protein LOC142526688 [Primulina tabacum]|uniref:uncharacterized protein LOC142526688 n=1 Tax=Primulina tabacum TaxID=48773 RepID=UPI003F5A2547